MEKLKLTPAAKAWCLIGAFVVGYDIACPRGETLSEGADRGLERHPYLTAAMIGTTALHLANVLPEKVDPFHHFVKLARRTP